MKELMPGVELVSTIVKEENIPNHEGDWIYWVAFAVGIVIAAVISILLFQITPPEAGGIPIVLGLIFALLICVVGSAFLHEAMYPASVHQKTYYSVHIYEGVDYKAFKERFYIINHEDNWYLVQEKNVESEGK